MNPTATNEFIHTKEFDESENRNVLQTYRGGYFKENNPLDIKNLANPILILFILILVVSF